MPAATGGIHVFPRERTGECYELAKRMAKYGRRQWIVWWLVDGTHKAAKISRPALEACMAEAVGSEKRPGYFTSIDANTGTGMNVSPGLAAVWHSNMVAGHFQY